MPQRNMRGQRQLHEDAMHMRRLIEAADAVEQIDLANLDPEANDLGFDADLAAGAHLVADVNRGCRVISDHDNREGRLDAMRLQCTRALGNADPYLSGDRDAIDNFRNHTRSKRVSART